MHETTRLRVARGAFKALGRSDPWRRLAASWPPRRRRPAPSGYAFDSAFVRLSKRPDGDIVVSYTGPSLLNSATLSRAAKRVFPPTDDFPRIDSALIIRPASGPVIEFLTKYFVNTGVEIDLIRDDCVYISRLVDEDYEDASPLFDGEDEMT